MQSRETGASAQSDRGVSPSGQFAGIHLDSASSMAGSESGGNTESRMTSSPDRTMGARSASPAKRSAADMEDVGSSDAGQQTQQTASGRLLGGRAGAADGSSEAVNGEKGHMDTQETATDSSAPSQPGTGSTSATSMQSDDLPSYTDSQNDQARWSRGSSNNGQHSIPSLDEQVKQVLELINSAPLDEGTQTCVVSAQWLSRVVSRTTENATIPDFPKEAREGPVGPVDNSDIVPDGAFDSELVDAAGRRFVPLKPGLTMGEDFQVVPKEAWGLILGWYPRPQGSVSHEIVRYVHNTADPPAANYQYELYPPLIGLRKVPQPSEESRRSPTPPSGSVEALRRRKQQRSRGQNSPNDTIWLVASRSERFKHFLTRAKEATGIPLTTRVKLWRQLAPENVATESTARSDAGMPSPPQSRSSSPINAAQTAVQRLVVTHGEFQAMQVGKDIEHIDAKDVTVNDKYNGSSTLEVYGMFENQTILLEEQIGGPAGGEFQSNTKSRPKNTTGKNSNGSSTGSAPASGRTSPSNGGMVTRGRTRRDGRTRGTVGLSNLGNTCYMNSALQCIRSVEELAIFFLSDKFKKDINTSNPLGHGGVMAKKYAELLQGIYGDNAAGSFTPNAFKKALGNNQPLFAGYGQQDSQEFLSFLVDALHEDLNRIIKKPYLENPDSDDKTVHDPSAIIELGNTYRDNHKARNDSVAMDLFSGFYKNTMECPQCDKVSVTFDPFSLVTLQLPIESTFQHPFTFVPLHGAPVNHAIDIDKNASIKTLKENIASKHPGVTADRLWMIEVYNHKIYKLFENHHTIAESNIGSNDYIFVFELSDVPTNIPEPSKKSAFYSTYSSVDRDVPDMDSPKADCFAVPILSRQQSRYSAREIIMHPLYITLSREEAKDFDVILKKVLIAVSQTTSRPILTELDEDASQPIEETTTVATGEKDESPAEDAAQVSDRSVPSEDGYVNVTLDKGEEAASVQDTDVEPERKANPVPTRFMDPQYSVPEGLRTRLFDIGYAKSAEGAYCTGLNSIHDKTFGKMLDRVKLPMRRGSSQSSASEDSSTDVGQGSNGEAEESDADDDEEQPDIMIGMTAEDSAETGTDEELPTDPLTDGFSNQRAGRRRQQGKKDKYQKSRKGKPITYGKKSRKPNSAKQQRPGSSDSLQSWRSSSGKTFSQASNPYYIKLGEAIVLDWTNEALVGLYHGDPNDDDDMRGCWLSTADGRRLDFVHDPVLEAKKKTRAARKANGITLEDCFAETGKREILSEDNAWYCNRCKEMRQAAKTLEIWTIPDILIVHLKRFGGNRSFRDKIDVFVDYPITGLDMSEKIGLREDGKEYVYDLFAVDNHYGGLGGGHYTALAKNFYDGQWYNYNGKFCRALGKLIVILICIR